MRVFGILSCVTAVAGNPMAGYLASLHGRDTSVVEAVTVESMNQFNFYAQHAAAAYCNAQGPMPGAAVHCPGVCDAVMRSNATIINAFQGDTTGIAGYVSVDDVRRELVFSVRGSHNIRNFIDDVFFATYPCEFGPGCKIHAGFSDAWDEIATAAMATIREARRAYPGYRVVVTGHSLGGAVAALGGAHLRRNGIPSDLYTFGAPRVGNAAFANYLNNQTCGPLPSSASSSSSSSPSNSSSTLKPSNLHRSCASFRMTHLDDPVPRLPPMFLGFRHSANEYWLSDGGVMQNVYQASDVKVCEGIANAKCNAGTFGANILAHLHYLTNTADCASYIIFWKRGNRDAENEELRHRLNQWSKADQSLVVESEQ